MIFLQNYHFHTATQMDMQKRLISHSGKIIKFQENQKVVYAPTTNIALAAGKKNTQSNVITFHLNLFIHYFSGGKSCAYFIHVILFYPFDSINSSNT